ncbi:MAG: ADP compounds hydrolase NudE, partial [Pseudomonadota bacterium]
MTQKKHPTPPQILSNEVVAKSRLFTVESLELKFSNDEQRQYE